MSTSHWSQSPPFPPTGMSSDPVYSPESGMRLGRYQVLLVDRSPDNREVLRTALERRGIGTLDTGQPAVGLAWARQHHPALIVLDSDWERGTEDSIVRDYADATEQSCSRMLILGSATTTGEPGPPEHITKPYHYAPLIRKIEQMIAEACAKRNSTSA